MMRPLRRDVETQPRFEFGENWQRFLSTVTDESIRIAETSIQEMLKTDSLRGKTVLDIGSGSGLFSLAARNLGAKVHSFDLDPLSVACTQELRSRYFPDDPDWRIVEGSILDEHFLKSLPAFDIVYAWGVLHHTGKLWTALENAASLVNANGTLFIAIYNDQGRISRFWKHIKQLYGEGLLGRTVVSGIFFLAFFLSTLLFCAIRRENVFKQYKKNRGMSIVHDWRDWLGGYPFEVASAEAISRFLSRRGFQLKTIKTTKGSGNNQFVFDRCPDR